MYKACGNTVQSVWVSTFITCWHSSTEKHTLPYLVGVPYGYLRVIPSYVRVTPTTYTQRIIALFNLLRSMLSPLSTAPIITNKKI